MSRRRKETEPGFLPRGHVVTVAWCSHVHHNAQAPVTVRFREFDTLEQATKFMAGIDRRLNPTLGSGPKEKT